MATGDSPTDGPSSVSDGESEDGSRGNDVTRPKNETRVEDKTETETEIKTETETENETENETETEVENETENEDSHDHNHGTDETQPGPALTEQELAALHEVELGLEWIQRAQGCLLEFHHATGHGMDHIDEAETYLRATGHDDLAAIIRRDLLPHGVVDDDRWSYDVLEDFQATLLEETVALERRVRTELADGERHVAERRQEREWKYPADEER